MSSVLSLCYPVVESSQVGEARRGIGLLAERNGFADPFRSNLAIIVTELANNLVKHSGGGQIVARALSQGGDAGIEVLSIDRAPGMANPEACLRDGFSTAGSPGTGLGAVRRLSTTFDFYSEEGKGSVILSQLWVGRGPPESAYREGAIAIPYRGEIMSGDAWGIRYRESAIQAVMVDGLGHGPIAADAAEIALRVFERNPDLSPSDYIKATHIALKTSRGAAVAVARIDLDSGLVEYCGVGNTVGAVEIGSEHKRMVSHNGTAGLQTNRIQEFRYPWDEGAILILHSDGIGTRWNLEKYPGLVTRHPAVIAGVLHRDFGRGTDDSTVLVLKRYETRGRG